MDGTWPLTVLFLPQNAPPLCFLLALSSHILTLSSSGATGGSREEMTGNKTMERPCQLPAIAWSLLPQLEHFRLYHQHTDWWRQQHKLVYSYILLYKHTNGKNRERERTQDSTHVIKTGPQGTESRLYISSYFEKDLDCIYLPPKCKCHSLLERCITI